MKLEVLYEDNHLIAVNKPAGLLVQGDKTGDTALIDLTKQYVKKKYRKPGDVYLGLIHRLDRPVSGVVVMARTSKALTRMNELFRTREVEKKYWCIVGEMPDPLEATIEHFLVKNENQNKSSAYNSKRKGSKPASLHYRLISRSAHFSLLEVSLHTGRHHQIRSQLSKIGSPIRGDLKYGYPKANPDGSISLHARNLSFIHPVRKETIFIEAPCPTEALWNELGN